MDVSEKIARDRERYAALSRAAHEKPALPATTWGFLGYNFTPSSPSRRIPNPRDEERNRGRINWTDIIDRYTQTLQRAAIPFDGFADAAVASREEIDNLTAAINTQYITSSYQTSQPGRVVEF